MMISIYSNIKQVKDGKEIPFDIFLDNIKEGKWQDIVLPIRAIKKDDERANAKKKVPYVTISGTFRERTDAGILKHSGFVGIDIDDVDPEETKSIICPDKYVYAAFTSISGRGLCVVIKINGERHREAFNAIREYLFDKYEIIIDPTAVNPSRARFISYDPHMYLNTGAEKFTAIPKIKAEKKVPEVVFVQNDFDMIVKEIVSRSIDITSDYNTWLKIGFALTDKFGEGGRLYYHSISQFSSQYDPKICDKQYTNCLKAKGSKAVTIATFYYLAKQAGIQTISAQTRLITQTAVMAKKGKRPKESVVQLLNESEGIPSSDSEPIVSQVFDNNITPDVSESIIDDLELWIRQNYDLRKNVITRMIENNGKDMEEEDLNSVFIAAKKIFDKGLTSEILFKLLFSRFIPEFNPFMEFFSKYQARKPKGLIKQLFETIETDTGLTDADFFPTYAEHFGTKWLVGMISAMHGQHSPLMLVLSGNKQGTGKTEFWNRLLPAELKKYFAESKLDRGKDDEILMTQKILILDDEMSAKNDKQLSAFKRLASKQVFSLRAPYGKNNLDMNRIAVLCGTTQENEILSDPTGNRRIIPINVLSINHAAYNAVDKIDLIMEAYWLYKEGFQWQLSSHDIKMLNENTEYFEEPSLEYELINLYFEIPTKIDKHTPFYAPAQVKSLMEIKSAQKLDHKKIGAELKKMGVKKIPKSVNGRKIKVYNLIERGITVDGSTPKWIDG